MSRRQNLGAMLRHVHRFGPTSRSQLTEGMGLNRSTIAALASTLEGLGLVRAVEPPAARAGVGRPSAWLDADPDGARVLGVDVGVDRVEVALVGLGGRVLDRARVELPAPPAPEEAVRLVARLASGMRAPTVGVGLSVPGVVRREDGVVAFAPNLGWIDVPLAELARERLAYEQWGDSLPVRLANDADLGALAEQVRGSAVGVGDLVYVSGDVGVGAGVISGGAPLGGSGGFAGEVGHMSIEPDGPLCHCGNRGCWETRIGAVAIADAIGVPRARVPQLADALAAYRGPTESLGVIALAAGHGLSNLVNLLNPDLIILGGYLAALHDIVGPGILAETRARALTAPGRQVRLCVPALGRDAVLIGAAELAFAPLLDDPAGFSLR